MVSFIALYRGPSLSAAELVAVSTDPVLVGDLAGALLDERARAGNRTDDPATLALTEGKRQALELVRDEAQALSSPTPRRRALRFSKPAPDGARTLSNASR